jgi:YVTN family beta-propeller protein
MGFNQSKDQVGQAKAIVAAKKKKEFYVYVSDAKKGTVSIFNPVTCKLIQTMHVMKEELTELVMSRDGAWLYATSYTCNAVYFFDVASCKLVKTIGDVRGATTIASDLDGKRLYVVGWIGFIDGIVYVINIATYEVVKTFDVGGPSVINISPDGMQLYVSNLWSSALCVFDTNNNYRRVIDTNHFHSLFVACLGASPDGNKLYVASSYDNKISIIDTRTFNNINDIDIKYNIHPYRLTLSPDGTHLYVLRYINNISSNRSSSNEDEVSILVIELATHKVTKFAASDLHFTLNNCHSIGVSMGVVVQPKSLKQLCLECLQQHDIPVPFSVIDEDVCRPLSVEFAS